MTPRRAASMAALLLVACGAPQRQAAPLRPSTEPAASAAAPAPAPAPPVDAPEPPLPVSAPSTPDGGTLSAPVEDGAAAPPDRHCLLLELRDPREETAIEVERMLTAEGLEVSREGADVALLVNEAEIRRIFGARLRWSTTGASTTSTMIREPRLQGGRVPARLRSRVAGFAIGHQICE